MNAAPRPHPPDATSPGHECESLRGSGGRLGKQTSNQRSTADEVPEHRGDRRRFLVWSLMAGFVPPERVTERVIDELRREAGQ